MNMDYTNTKHLSDEKIMRVYESKQYGELTDDELKRLYWIATIESAKANKSLAKFIKAIFIIAIIIYAILLIIPKIGLKPIG